MIFPTIAKIGMPNASGDFVKADKKGPRIKGDQIGIAKLFDLSRQDSWPA